MSSGKQWVFPSDLQASDDHIKDLSGSYKAIGNQANLYITPHDLRRTFGTGVNPIFDPRKAGVDNADFWIGYSDEHGHK